MDIVAHFRISGKVVDLSCCSVLAETTTVEEGNVENNHKAIQAKNADLPMPLPLDRAIFISSGVMSKDRLRLFSRIWFRMSLSASRCHWRGPL
tara:strand:- start:330 stop:608 length:279 start_codon:yes stop_codon:yes gene_type:complete